MLLLARRLYLTREMDRHLEVSPYGTDILFTGSVTRDVLRRLYGAAEALTFVPWLEGFGIPVVEAQRCGTPCILSDSSSLPEVSGGAALCVSPADAGIAEAMARLVSPTARCATAPLHRRVHKLPEIYLGPRRRGDVEISHQSYRRNRLMLKPFFLDGIREAGCDEAGRGCAAGPVYAAAVILPKKYRSKGA